MLNINYILMYHKNLKFISQMFYFYKTFIFVIGNYNYKICFYQHHFWLPQALILSPPEDRKVQIMFELESN